MQTLAPYAAVHVFPVDHPTSAGHFPGNAIIPGACLLREVMAAVGRVQGVRLRGMTSVKFLHPVRPGDSVEIAWSAGLPDTIRFTGVLAGTTQRVVTGALLLAVPSDISRSPVPSGVPSGATQPGPS